MNKWKIAFWICLTVLVLVTGISTFLIIDQAVTVTYMKNGYNDTENDLENLIKIVNETDFSKMEIINVLEKSNKYEFKDLKSDSIPLGRILLNFKDNKLDKITRQ